MLAREETPRRPLWHEILLALAAGAGVALVEQLGITARELLKARRKAAKRLREAPKP